MTKSEATKARIALISRLLQWDLGTLIVVASGTIGLLVSRPETLDMRAFNIFTLRGMGTKCSASRYRGRPVGLGTSRNQKTGGLVNEYHPNSLHHRHCRRRRCDRVPACLYRAVVLALEQGRPRRSGKKTGAKRRVTGVGKASPPDRQMEWASVGEGGRVLRRDAGGVSKLDSG